MSDAELDAMIATAKTIDDTHGAEVGAEYAVRRLAAEIRRLRRGEFTPEEFQAICHHRDERPGCSRADFINGCAEYQEKLFGPVGV